MVLSLLIHLLFQFLDKELSFFKQKEDHLNCQMFNLSLNFLILFFQYQPVMREEGKYILEEENAQFIHPAILLHTVLAPKKAMIAFILEFDLRKA